MNDHVHQHTLVPFSFYGIEVQFLNNKYLISQKEYSVSNTLAAVLVTKVFWLTALLLCSCEQPEVCHSASLSWNPWWEHLASHGPNLPPGGQSEHQQVRIHVCFSHLSHYKRAALALWVGLAPQPNSADTSQLSITVFHPWPVATR